MEKKMEQALWERCTAFHGHICPGLAIGFRAALYAAQLLELDFSQDEQTVCIAENDACGVDAIQVVLGCSAGKGNLLFHLRGKQAFSFYHRPSGRSVRLCLKPRPQGMTREQSLAYYRERPDQELFAAGPTRIPLPQPAKIFRSVACSRCGEVTAEQMVRLQDGQPLCLDCYEQYDRFQV